MLTASNGVQCRIDYTLRGTITYNPNTFQITYASKPILVDRTIDGPDQYSIITKNESATSKIASNKLSATFTYEFDVEGKSNFNNLNFGKASYSFTMTTD